MIIRATAIPLAIYPYSTTSRIVHWLTRHQGKISTVLKGALRPKSPFLGEYELFSTSELLFYSKQTNTLFTAKECALLTRRPRFRTDWRAMQTASYLTALTNKTTPEHAPHLEQFSFFEELLDLTEQYGQHLQFMIWAELKFCQFHGHTPQTSKCVICASTENLRFCSSQGGVTCSNCAREHKLPTLECPSDILAIINAWQQTEHPSTVINTQLNARQKTQLNAIAGTFMLYHFNIQPHHRNAVLQAA